MGEILENLSELTAKLTLPLTFLLVIIYVLRKLGKGKDKSHIINVWNRRLRKVHKPMGITLAAVALVHGISAESPMLWGIICLVSIFMLVLSFVLRKKIKKPNWMKVHRVLVLVMLASFALHMIELKIGEDDDGHYDDISIEVIE